MYEYERNDLFHANQTPKLCFFVSQKHSLLEADITVVGERVMTTKASALHYADAENEDIGGYKPCDPNIIKDRCAHLDAAYDGEGGWYSLE